MTPAPSRQVFRAHPFEDPDFPLTVTTTIRSVQSEPEALGVGAVVTLGDLEGAYAPAALKLGELTPLDHSFSNGWTLRGSLCLTDGLDTYCASQVIGSLAVTCADGRVWRYTGFICEFGAREDDAAAPTPPALPS